MCVLLKINLSCPHQVISRLLKTVAGGGGRDCLKKQTNKEKKRWQKITPV